MVRKSYFNPEYHPVGSGLPIFETFCAYIPTHFQLPIYLSIFKLFTVYILANVRFLVPLGLPIFEGSRLLYLPIFNVFIQYVSTIFKVVTFFLKV